jgi:hypothetical protein
MNSSSRLVRRHVERTAEGGVIRFERHLPYSIRDVWAAVTDPDRLADWWLPFDADITVDLREGGEMVFAGRGDEPFSMTFTILRVEAPMLLEHTHADPSSLMRWELEAHRRRLRAAPEPLRHRRRDAAIGNCYVVGLHTSLPDSCRASPATPTPWDWDGVRACTSSLRRPRPRPGGGKHEPRHAQQQQLLRVQNFGVSPTGSAPASARPSSGRSGTPTRRSLRGPSPPPAGRTEPSPAGRAGSTTTSPATSRTTSAPRSWAATSSARCAGPWETSTGRAGGATTPPFHTPVFVLTHHPRPSFTLADTTFHFLDATPAEALRQAKAAAEREGRAARRRRADRSAVPRGRSRRHDARRRRPDRDSVMASAVDLARRPARPVPPRVACPAPAASRTCSSGVASPLAEGAVASEG